MFFEKRDKTAAFKDSRTKKQEQRTKNKEQRTKKKEKRKKKKDFKIKESKAKYLKITIRLKFQFSVLFSNKMKRKVLIQINTGKPLKLDFN